MICLVPKPHYGRLSPLPGLVPNFSHIFFWAIHLVHIPFGGGFDGSVTYGSYEAHEFFSHSGVFRKAGEKAQGVSIKLHRQQRQNSSSRIQCYPIHTSTNFFTFE